ncbi:MAG: dynamin family protein [Polyangiaceae bacterium]
MLDAFRQRQVDVTSALKDLGTVAEELGAKTLGQRIARDLVTKLEEDRFHLVVVGEFNHGKSTFVNALLGIPALPVGVTPTTATIHHLRYADAPEATIVSTTKERTSLPFDELRKFAVGGGSSPDQVDYIEVGYPAPLLRERILLVDTPGVNDLSHQRADITYSYIPRADAVLFLLDAGQILKESERVFLEEKLLKASRDKIVFVITKWDVLSADERVEALAYAKTQLAKMVKNPVVFPVSAETALSGKMEESGMPELLSHLTRFLSEERGKILLGNALGEGLSVGELLSKGLDARRRSIAMKVEDLDRRIQMLDQDLAGQAGTIEQRRMKIREEISAIKMGARKDLERFIADVSAKLPEVIDAAKKEDLSNYLPSFLEDTFRKWAEAESKEIGEKLEELAEKTIALIRDDASETTKRVAGAMGTDLRRLEVQVDTFKYDVGVGALFAVGLGTLFVNLAVGGVLLVAAPVLALVVKGRIDAEYKKQAKEAGPQILKQAGERVAPKMDEMIEEFATRLDTWVVTAGEELHREILEVLHATREKRIAGGMDETRARADLDLLATRLEASRARVQTLREELEGPSKPSEMLRIEVPEGTSTTATA